jgi:hypothetical protein
MLLLTVSPSVRPSWLRAPDCDSWPYFSLLGIFVYCLSWGVHHPSYEGLHSSFCIVYFLYITFYIIIIIIIIIIISNIFLVGKVRLSLKAYLRSGGIAPRII